MKISKLIFHVCLVIAPLVFINTNVFALQFSKDYRKNIKIGLLITDNKSHAAKQGAELAIRKANENGGYNGRHFELVVRSMEGPWGTGSKQAVNLIFDEQVCAILGSHDGRNAHLVEQVAVKTRVVFMSSWAGDPTLSQAFVPWYFSCVPNDLQQADILIEEIYNSRKYLTVATVADSSYDSSIAVKSFLKRARATGKNDPVQLTYDIRKPYLNDLVQKIQNSQAKCIILFGEPSSSVKILQHIRLKKINITIFGSMALLNENAINGQVMNSFEGVVFSSSGFWLNPESSSFNNEYKKSYGVKPGLVAAYAFDGMNLIIKAVRDGGPDRDNIQKSLMKIKSEGVTGTIQFDTKGNRLNSDGLMEIKNGVPVPSDK
jgi:branched-chain amino acid transport system substrate-binding protein